MRIASLEFLRCPACGGELDHAGEVESRRLPEGELICRQGDHRYPVRAGIPRFIEPQQLIGLNRRYETLYNLIAPVYDSESFIASRIRRQFWPAGEARARQEVVGRLAIGSRAQVLETGIGSGGNIPYILDSAPQAAIYGVDISIAMLRQCVRRLQVRRQAASLFLANCERLPFKDESFDVVFHLGAINNFTDKKQALDEMIRVARPGTRLVIADETEDVSEGPFAETATRLFFGDRLSEEIYRFRPDDLRPFIPAAMRDVRFDSIWEGKGYRIEFTKR